MTGPEHYLEAETTLRIALDGIGRAQEHGAATVVEVTRELGPALAIAQVHATLALAAATAQLLADRYVGDGDHINAWTKAGVR